MKVHTPSELVNRLSTEIAVSDRDASFSVRSVDAPPLSNGYVAIAFDLDGLYVRMDRDRAEVDFFVHGRDGEWQIIDHFRDVLAQMGRAYPPIKSKQLFDPGYSEEGAIVEGVRALVAMRADIRQLIDSDQKEGEQARPSNAG